MKIIVPMAGIGKRMRPHTLTTPKPLLPIAGKPIVQHLVENIAEVCNEPIDEIAFIIGDFGAAVEQQLIKVAQNLGAKAHIFHQEEALGTAHAILCAKDCLSGKIIVAFADTLFKADFKLDTEKDGIIWVQKIEDPSAFGVVKVNDEGIITDFVEKPDTFVSDLAIIGIYYFKDGELLKSKLQYLIDNNIKEKGEFQLTNALENMKQEGIHFVPGKVDEWLDCGNKNATVYTNQRILEFNKGNELVAGSAHIENSKIIPPCYIGENVKIINATVGPHVSISENTRIENSTISNSIIYSNSVIKAVNISNSMIGNYVNYKPGKGENSEVSIGDYSTIE